MFDNVDTSLKLQQAHAKFVDLAMQEGNVKLQSQLTRPGGLVPSAIRMACSCILTFVTSARAASTS